MKIIVTSTAPHASEATLCTTWRTKYLTTVIINLTLPTYAGNLGELKASGGQAEL